MDSIDRQIVPQPLTDAQAKGIAVVGMYAFDGNDPHAGGQAQGLYGANPNFGPASKDYDTILGRKRADLWAAGGGETAASAGSAITTTTTTAPPAGRRNLGGKTYLQGLVHEPKWVTWEK